MDFGAAFCVLLFVGYLVLMGCLTHSSLLENHRANERRQARKGRK